MYSVMLFGSDVFKLLSPFAKMSPDDEYNKDRIT